MSSVHSPNSDILQRYYAFQSTIYDGTRWSFLFGRRRILDLIAKTTQPQYILEIGCGTGFNLKRLSKRFPEAKIAGMDVSTDMLGIAQKKLRKYPNVQLVHGVYGEDPHPFGEQAPDVILFSYVLSMVSHEYANLILRAYRDLKPEGHIAVVDFYRTDRAWFKRHMSKHHVRMEGQLSTPLKIHFESRVEECQSAYGGIWQYFSFIGKK